MPSGWRAVTGPGTSQQFGFGRGVGVAARFVRAREAAKQISCVRVTAWAVSAADGGGAAVGMKA